MAADFDGDRQSGNDVSSGDLDDQRWRDVMTALKAPIRVPVYAYIWAGICAMVGCASLLYGAKEANDEIFLSSFVWWGLITLPLLFNLAGRILHVLLYFWKTTTAILILSGMCVGLYLILRSDITANVGPGIERLQPLLTDSVFVRLASVFLIAFVLLSFMTVAGVLLLRFLKGYFDMNKTDSDVEKHVTLTQLEKKTDVEMARIDLEKEIELKKLELEREVAKLKILQIEVQERERKLLTASSGEVPVGASGNGSPSKADGSLNGG